MNPERRAVWPSFVALLLSALVLTLTGYLLVGEPAEVTRLHAAETKARHISNGLHERIPCPGPEAAAWPNQDADFDTYEFPIERRIKVEGDWIRFVSPGVQEAAAPPAPCDPLHRVSTHALIAEHGLIEGAVDEPGYAVAVTVSDTPWHRVARQDEASLRVPPSPLAVLIAGSAGLFLITNVLALLWWRQADARKRAGMLQERLAHETLEQRYANLSHYANDIILLADEAGRIVDANDRAVEAYGYLRETLLGLPLSVLRASCGGDHGEDMTRLAQDGRLRYDATHRKRDGSLFPVEVSASRIKAGGRCYRQEIVRDLSEREAQEARIHQLAYFDELTGLPNRGLLKDRLDQAAALCRREEVPLAVLFLDLDYFKHVNDSLGHAAGDSLLQEIARRLSACSRAEDTVARLGGDEFVLLLHADARGAARTAEKLLALLSEPCLVEGHTLRVAASIGIALCPENGDDHESLLRAADTALALAKQTGRGTYRFFTSEMQNRAARRLQIEAALRQALEKDELILHYQPQVEAASGRIVGAEALVRWHHPAWGWVSPAEFIPVAEETGIIVDLGDWVLETAIAQAAAWRRDNLPPVAVAVNLSVAQFREADLVERVLSQLAHHGLPPAALEIEVTESVAMREAAHTEPLLRQFTEAGIALAIDDFGTGYSSLASLKHFRVSLLKIDSSFVAGLPVDTENGAIVNAVIRMAASLGARTLAEGVKTAAQLDWLRENGCQLVQGYHISEPLPPEAFADLLRSQDRSRL
jgi:diguanylate cyclase (GGDEF)-like protein/PAS domain S-box-containing protein